MTYKDVTVVIPAYKPDEKLISTLEELKREGFSDFVVVNDGSGEGFETIFDSVSAFEGTTLLVHPVNKGKGAALKTAFSYIAENRPDCVGVVTADADGQHLTCDIIAVSEEMVNTGKVVLGCRDFSQSDVPARSRFGNKLTSLVFKLLVGMKVSDTQTGLRAFPAKYLAQIAESEGDRYEFETNMLFLMHRQNIPYTEVTISTVYIEENKSSHFRVVRDSIRIYSMILKYAFNSVISFVIDALIYYLLRRFRVFDFLPIPLTFSSYFVARAISSVINYLINAKVVFHGKVNGGTLAKYYALAVFNLAISSSVAYLLENVLNVTSPLISTLIKILVDAVLFLLSFRIQNKWVFSDKEKGENE
ncbi:MAG: bifunctional glycosyltransferase family 2/GtrA family protein [Clostridia bacterium]|nr:bifunctional glycosyltransferase family 2/GtrA family protein [Clostridia bacterium]